MSMTISNRGRFELSEMAPAMPKRFRQRAAGRARAGSGGAHAPAGSVLGLEQAAGLVVPGDGGRSELLLELGAVVRAEQELAGGEGDADVGLGPAAVAAVERAEGRQFQFVDGVGGDLRHGVLLRLGAGG